MSASVAAVVTVDGRRYQVEKMPPRDQLHTFRRLAPIVGPVLPAALKLMDDGASKKEAMAEIARLVGPLADALAAMPDDQLDYVMDSCLSRVKVWVEQAKLWQPVYVLQRGAAPLRMYEDIELNTELRLVSEVVKANLSGFFGALSAAPASSTAAPGAARAASTT